MCNESLPSTDPAVALSARQLAAVLANELECLERKVVFAESCTAGLASAALAQTPGISRWLCGSVVTYRESAKQQWLGIETELLAQHTAVSPQVTARMAEAVLKQTDAADFAVAITGHLETGAAAEGAVAFVTVAFRHGDSVKVSKPVCYRLAEQSRVDRQWEAARAALNGALDYLRRRSFHHQHPEDNPDTSDEPTSRFWETLV